ncbi:DUF4158 domain-containing protein [Candidatus Jidaibacter acanthamoebae]|uniref:DUF4158 domain-containing protein n=1 Tax=Candidatus Jidaibacter acanthamoebae TaxID=86105 RepID=UPI00057E4C91|nr:DUF4158 domain-containing protein [Candidatus Jidaibacter acanthamoeba]
MRTTNEGFLNSRQRYQPISMPQEFSDEEMARDWTLSAADKHEISNYRKIFRTFIALQLCALRLYGRFISNTNTVSVRIINYLNEQLNLPPSLAIMSPERDATFSEQRKSILEYLGFRKYDENIQNQLIKWLHVLAKQGNLPNGLFEKAEHYLLTTRVILPGPTVLERLIISVCGEVHQQLFDTLYQSLPAKLKTEIDSLLVIKADIQASPFQLLKEYPPSATISSLKFPLLCRRMLSMYNYYNKGFQTH